MGIFDRVFGSGSKPHQAEKTMAEQGFTREVAEPKPLTEGQKDFGRAISKTTVQPSPSIPLPKAKDQALDLSRLPVDKVDARAEMRNDREASFAVAASVERDVAWKNAQRVNPQAHAPPRVDPLHSAGVSVEQSRAQPKANDISRIAEHRSEFARIDVARTPDGRDHDPSR